MVCIVNLLRRLHQLISNLDVSRGNHVDRRTSLDSKKKILGLARFIFDRNHRIRSYCILSKRDIAQLILLLNRGDRDLS